MTQRWRVASNPSAQCWDQADDDDDDDSRVKTKVARRWNMKKRSAEPSIYVVLHTLDPYSEVEQLCTNSPS